MVLEVVLEVLEVVLEVFLEVSYIFIGSFGVSGCSGGGVLDVVLGWNMSKVGT